LSMKVKQTLLKSLTTCAVLALVCGCSLRPAEEQALKPPLVKPVKENFELYDVKRGTLTKQINATASVTSSSTENLYFKESGPRIQSVDVKLGDVIKPGDVVAQLDKGDLESKIRVQLLNLEKVKIALEQTKQDQMGNITSIRLKMIDVEAAQIQLDQLQLQLEKTKLVSTISGIVTYMDALKTGDPVTAYKPVITVSDPNKVQLVYENSNTSDLIGITVGMEVKVKILNNEVKGKVLQTPGSTPYTENKAQADRNARTIIFGVDRLQEQAKIGSTASVLIETDRVENVIVIPRQGLRSYLGRDYVQILDGESRKEIDVEKGLQTSTEVEIRKGLKEGQKIILNN
jgi:RND family efflux transporter MFP subunit